MELRHLRYFIAVAEELHFGRAAARLGIAQPPLSMQIRDLERELGARLFARTNRRVTLTEAGRVFLDGARRTIAQLEDATLQARLAGRGEIGELRIGYVSSATYQVLPYLLRAFRDVNPGVVMRLHMATSLEQTAALREGRLDVGILRLPVDEATLDWRAVTDEPLVAVLPASHPLAAQKRTPLAALAGEAFILYPRADNPGIHDAIIELCMRAGFSPIIAHETGNMQAITALVAGGLGVALVIAPPGLRMAPDVVVRPLDGADIPIWRTALAWRREREVAPVVRAFLTASEPVVGRMRDRSAATGSDLTGANAL